MIDLLRMDFINSLPQPLLALAYGDGDWWWPIYDIDVETGVMRIDVCGLLQVKHMSDAKQIKDADGGLHSPDDLYTESQQEQK